MQDTVNEMVTLAEGQYEDAVIRVVRYGEGPNRQFATWIYEGRTPEVKFYRSLDAALAAFANAIRYEEYNS